MKSHLQFAKALSKLMDTQFTVFGIRFGLDPFLDFWPGFGSFIGAAVSCYLFWIAYKLKVPKNIYVKMAWHIFLDFFLGELPFIGFIFDIFYRANEKNLALLAPYADPEVLVGEIVNE
jgi:hypothetical protein